MEVTRNWDKESEWYGTYHPHFHVLLAVPKNVQTVKDLDKILVYKRLISYGGLLKEIHKELNLEDAKDGDLIHIDEDSDEMANGAVDVMAYWHVGLNNYVIFRRNALNDI